MKLKYLLLFLSFYVFSNSIYAQKGKKDKDVEIIDFGDDSGDNSSDGLTSGNIIIKTSPVSYLTGSQFVEVEKYVTDYLSVQAGFGLTFRPLINYTYDEALAELQDDGSDFCESDNFSDDRDICDDYYNTDFRRYKIGILVSGSARLFFDDDAMDGGYFAFKLRYSTLNLEVQNIFQNSQSIERLEDDWLPESVKRFDIMGHYGYQSVFSKLTASYFVGLGARIQNESREDLGFNSFGLIEREVRSFKRTRLRLEAGIRIGFQL